MEIFLQEIRQIFRDATKELIETLREELGLKNKMKENMELQIENMRVVTKETQEVQKSIKEKVDEFNQMAREENEFYGKRMDKIKYVQEMEEISIKKTQNECQDLVMQHRGKQLVLRRDLKYKDLGNFNLVLAEPFQADLQAVVNGIDKQDDMNNLKLVLTELFQMDFQVVVCVLQVDAYGTGIQTDSQVVVCEGQISRDIAKFDTND